MTVDELKQAFHIQTKDIAEITGYTRQGLWSLLNKKSGIKKERFERALINLRIKSYDIYENDIKLAKKTKAEREECLSKLKQYLK